MPTTMAPTSTTAAAEDKEREKDLKASLERHNAEFEALLRLIPAKFYLVPEDFKDSDFGELPASKYHKHSKKQKEDAKLAVKEAKAKARRDKLDPANNKSIVELQDEAAALKKRGKSDTTRLEKTGKGKARAPESSDNEDDDEAGSDEDEEGDMEVDMDHMEVNDADENDLGGGIGGGKRSGGRKEEAKAVEYKPMVSESIETLRAKLRARMEGLRRRNGRNSSNSNANSNAKINGDGSAGSKDELLEERRQARAAMRERRRKETKEKKRREQEEKGKKGKDKEKEKEKQQTTSGQTIKQQLLVPDISAHQTSSSSPSNNYTNIAFSSLSNSTPTLSKSLKTSSNPAQALTQLTKRAEARAALPPEKRKELEEREAWAKASARVSGAKVHDDPSRLQKAAKRREKGKEKSKKEWETRKEEVTKAQAAKQKKRTDNIAMRHDKRKGGSGKKDTKRRPGFEGKSFGGGTKKAGSGAKGKR